MIDAIFYFFNPSEHRENCFVFSFRLVFFIFLFFFCLNQSNIYSYDHNRPTKNRQEEKNTIHNPAGLLVHRKLDHII